MASTPYRISESYRQAPRIDRHVSRHYPSISDLTTISFIQFSKDQELICSDMYGDMPLGCYVVPQARVIPTRRGDYGYISVATGPIVEQNADFLRKGKFLRPRLFEMILDTMASETRGDVVVLTSRCHNNFWHWMMDSMPKVLIAERCGFQGAYLVPPASVAPWASEALQLVGIGDERLIRLSGHSIEIERLYLPTYFCGYNAHTNRRFSREYRQWILDRVSPGAVAAGRRVFVGRAETAPARRVLNQSELADFLRGEGFEQIYFERLALRDQIRLAKEASVLVAGHGSGLTHLLFMPENALVLELFPHKRQQTNDCYEALSTIVPQRYRALESHMMREGDIEVDPQHIRRILVDESVI